MRALGLIACCAWLLGACGLGGDVKEDGQYTFLPGARVADTAPYPLRHLLVIEDDAASDRAFVYLFSGQLARAGVGLPDLRRIALQSRGFQMKFETPRARYADVAIESRGLPLQARFGSRAFELARLDDASLAQSGANRWLGSTQSGDYDVAAYFAVVPHDAPLGALTVEVEGEPIRFEPALMEATLQTRIADDALQVGFASGDAPMGGDGGGDAGPDAGADAGADAGPAPALALTTNADYLLVDLWQPIIPKPADEDADGGALPAETEAIVRYMLTAGGIYAAPRSLITDAAGQGCWSSEAPLQVRASQLYRRYVPRAGGDLGVIHQRLESSVVGADAWTALLDEPKPASYCEGYE